MLDTLLVYPWLLAVLWAGMYIFDYASTVWLTQVYRSVLNRYVVWEHGVELNPNFEKEIASRKVLSLKFVILLVLVVVVILLSGWLAVLVPWPGYLFEEFLAGALLLTWSFVNSRHLRNYAHVWFLAKRPDALKGRQELSYWLMQKQLSAEAFTFSVIYLFLVILTWRVFFLGGALACLTMAVRAYRLANREFPAFEMTRG